MSLSPIIWKFHGSLDQPDRTSGEALNLKFSTTTPKRQRNQVDLPGNSAGP